MKIEKQPSSVQLTFSPADYFLVKEKEEWHLAPRIDRSYKGKDDDIGSPVLMLEDGQEKTFQDALFTEVHI